MIGAEFEPLNSVTPEVSVTVPVNPQVSLQWAYVTHRKRILFATELVKPAHWVEAMGGGLWEAEFAHQGKTSLTKSSKL